MNEPCPSDGTLAAFVDGRLDAAGRRQVVEHLADCAECRDTCVAVNECEVRNPEPNMMTTLARAARMRFWSARTALFVTGLARGWALRSAVDRFYHGERGALVALLAFALALLVGWYGGARPWRRRRRDLGQSMDYREIITIDPGKRGGQACIRGMRIAVSDVLSYLAAGMTDEDVLSDFPELTHDDVRACLSYAADREHA